MNEPISKETKIYVAGHRGMVGSAIVRRLKEGGYSNLILRSRTELDLTQQSEVADFFQREHPEYVFLAAAKVGGIAANNTQRAEFIYNNLMIELNIINAAWQAGVKNLQFLGSSCIYPRDCAQPIKEDYLLTGPLEQTNEPYAIAKIAGIKLCESYNRQYCTRYTTVMPTNLYGPGDNYDLYSSHVLPALMKKAHLAKIDGAKELVVWGSGRPRREFLYVDDLADACVYLMETGIGEGMFNIGVGKDISIAELAQTMMEIVGYHGTITYDSSKPDGTPQKLLSVDRLTSMGWKAKTSLREGISRTYKAFVSQHS